MKPHEKIVAYVGSRYFLQGKAEAAQMLGFSVSYSVRTPQKARLQDITLLFLPNITDEIRGLNAHVWIVEEDNYPKEEIKVRCYTGAKLIKQNG